MQLTQRPFSPGIPGYLLTIGQHSMRLMVPDLIELSTLVARALEKLAPEEEEQATTKRMQTQLVEKRKRGRKSGNLCKTLRELDLADEAIREAEKPADDIPLYTQILKLRPHCRLVVPKAFGYKSVNGTCSMVRRRHNIPVHVTKMKFSGDIVVYRKG